MSVRDLALVVGLLPVAAALATSGTARSAPPDPAGAASAPSPPSPPAAVGTSSSSPASAPARRPRDRAALAAIRDALAAHQASNFGDAARKLRDAAERCGMDQCSPGVKASVLVALGVVRAAGLRKQDEAVGAFEQALRLDAQAALPAQADAPTQQLFQSVRDRLFPPPAPVEPEPAQPAPVQPEPVQPAPVEVPVAPLRNVGDASWKHGVGLVRTGDEPTPPVSEPSWGRPISLAAPEPLRLDEFEFQLRLGQVTYDPINDGETDADDATDLSGVLIELMLRPEWRSAASPVAIWFDLRFGLMPRKSGPLQMPNRAVKPIDARLTHMRFGGHLGVDVVPAEFVGFGPFAGYRGDAFFVRVDDEDSLSDSAVEDSAYGAFDHGLEYGGHLRLRSRDRVGRPALLYGDAAMFRRKGVVQTGLYQRFELGVRPGASMQLSLWYERRSSAAGYTAISEIEDPADILGKTMSVESMIGIGIGTAFSTAPVDSGQSLGATTAAAPGTGR